LPAPVKPRLESTPRKVEIALTGACNLTCAYCSYSATQGARHPDDMPTGKLLALLDELGECAVMSVILTGGEPLLRPDFLEIVQGVVRNRMRFSINTNGVLLTEELVQTLIATRRLDNVQISLDGAEAWINDKNRGKGAFDGAIRGLGILARLGAPRAVRLTITRFTADGLEDALERLLELAPSVGTNEIMPFGRGGKGYEKLTLTAEQRPVVTEVLLRISAKYPGRVQSSAGPLTMAKEIASVQAQMDAGSCSSSRNGAGHLSSCGGFHQSLAILHDGTIISCIQLPDLPLGKVGELPLAELWTQNATLAELRNRWDVKLESLDYCKGCKYIPFCHGGCPANAVAVFGTHLAPDPVHCMRRLIDGVEFDSERVVHRGGGALHLRVL
jgi:SynChlorMet cassette radical SAM/SPASM protein ScmE